MTESRIPLSLVDLVSVRGVGCTGVTQMAIEVLKKLTDEPDRITESVHFLRRELSGYASLWHLERALASGAPAATLEAFGDRLELDARTAIETAHALLRERPGGFVTAPSSSLTRRVLAALGVDAANVVGSTGLCGADAVGPTDILNIVSTRELARRLPTVVVTTPDRLVPGGVFETLGSPLFERIPLSMFEAVVIGGDVLTPAEAGARAAALAAAHPA
ncbi:hypothetical protein [Cryptosporangium japonicum]|uniref:Uncharacterized protein n=1 Tax=Cryptosporangium japonicum TaxID=80872 RepID=A0ABP3EFA6_9ACTN